MWMYFFCRNTRLIILKIHMQYINNKQSRMLALEIFGRACFLIFFSLLAFDLLNDFFTHWRLSALILVFKESITLWFVALRSIPNTITIEPHAWLIALLGTSSSFFFRSSSIEDGFVGLIIQSLGVLIACIGIISLNKSFGVVPANRGVKRSGLYRVVRHPIYAGYTISYLGFLMNQGSYYNMAIFTSVMIFMVARIFLEEKLLMESPEYQELASRVKYRLIPGVW